MEKRVWTEVSTLLSDPQKLQDLAKEWLRIAGAENETSKTEFQRLASQEAKLLRAIALVQDDYYLAADAEQELLQRRIEKYRDDLASIANRKALLDAYRADSDLQNKQLQSLAELADSASDRLANLDISEQREVFELLGVRVLMSQIVNSEPMNITILGKIDERIATSSKIGAGIGGQFFYPEVSFTLDDNQVSG